MRGHKDQLYNNEVLIYLVWFLHSSRFSYSGVILFFIYFTRQPHAFSFALLISHMFFYQNTSFMLWEEFVKVDTKLYFISINYNILKVSKPKASNSVITFDQVMNDINTWLVDEDCDPYEIGDLDDLCGS